MFRKRAMSGLLTGGSRIRNLTPQEIRRLQGTGARRIHRDQRPFRCCGAKICNGGVQKSFESTLLAQDAQQYLCDIFTMLFGIKNIVTISWGYRSNIVGMSKQYRGDIVKISWEYRNNIVRIS
ncbi:hypothetical protein AVEN_158816-1 [Araneus ventricosus]|uniref:Uncharacterized protein n=1 Tax=Araneus ventricosus TaxID=182803 RepID=A0A4Y2HUQ1_ARAVE|nr:hypothetical protein AVEN_158816-1 [Araneus ventricosus]